MVCIMAIERPDLYFLRTCFAKVEPQLHLALPAADGEERQGEEEDGSSGGQS